jgi:CRISPR-associated endonuclease Cas2
LSNLSPYDLKKKLQKLVEAGISAEETFQSADIISPLSERIKVLLNIVTDKPKKAIEMTYLIMYDIENNKVRSRIAKYLEKNGCIRIQKSIFIAKSKSGKFEEILETLRDVQSYYQNEDSILLVPVNTSDIRSMKIIGKTLDIEILIDKPNTLFF